MSFFSVFQLRKFFQWIDDTNTFDFDGIVDPAEVMNKFDASQHPDVIAGKKTSEEHLLA